MTETYSSGESNAYVYDTVGNITQETVTTVENGTTTTTVTNYTYDSETGYYYLQSRYYDPSICRFINADLPQYALYQKNIDVGVNSFAYCCNNPIYYKDTSGHWVETAIDVASFGWSLTEFLLRPSWVNGAFVVWDFVAMCVPFFPGLYVEKAGKVTFKVASSVGELKNTKALTTGSYAALKKLFKKATIKGSRKVEIHHIIEKRFKKLFKVKPNDFFSIPLEKDLHKVITKRWRKEIKYGTNYSKISKSRMRKAINNVYYDMPELKKYALKWFEKNWKG